VFDTAHRERHVKANKQQRKQQLLQRCSCCSGTAVTAVQLLQRYSCYSGTAVTAIQLLQRYSCYSGTAVTAVQLLQRFSCYSGTAVTAVQLLQRYSCYSSTAVKLNSKVTVSCSAFLHQLSNGRHTAAPSVYSLSAVGSSVWRRNIRLLPVSEQFFSFRVFLL